LIVQGPTTEPERWLPGADATLLPSLYDSAANTTIEAMSCGVPPVTSGRDGSSEVVVDPRLTVDDPTDVEGFGLALEFAWETDQAEACRAEAARWTVARNGESVEAIYRQVANG